MTLEFENPPRPMGMGATEIREATAKTGEVFQLGFIPRGKFIDLGAEATAVAHETQQLLADYENIGPEAAKRVVLLRATLHELQRETVRWVLKGWRFEGAPEVATESAEFEAGFRKRSYQVLTDAVLDDLEARGWIESLSDLCTTFWRLDEEEKKTSNDSSVQIVKDSTVDDAAKTLQQGAA